MPLIGVEMSQSFRETSQTAVVIVMMPMARPIALPARLFRHSCWRWSIESSFGLDWIFRIVLPSTSVASVNRSFSQARHLRCRVSENRCRTAVAVTLSTTMATSDRAAASNSCQGWWLSGD